jgi:hypothetical protein
MGNRQLPQTEEQIQQSNEGFHVRAVKRAWNYFVSEGTNEETWRDFVLWLIEHFQYNIKELPGWECPAWKLAYNENFFSGACMDPDEDTDAENIFARQNNRFAKLIDDKLYLGSADIPHSDDSVIPVVEGRTGGNVIIVKFDDGADGELTLEEFQAGRALLRSYIEGIGRYAEVGPNDTRYVDQIMELWNQYKEAATEGGGKPAEIQARDFAALNLWMIENFHYNVAALPGWENMDVEPNEYMQNYHHYVGNLFQVTADVDCECTACEAERGSSNP